MVEEEREGVFLSTCFFLLLMAIHGDLLLEAWMDPGNPGISMEKSSSYPSLILFICVIWYQVIPPNFHTSIKILMY